LQVSFEQEVEPIKEEIIEIATSSVVPAMFLIRRSLGDLNELKQSIVNNGLLHPIVIRRTSTLSQFQLISGTRRLEAFRQLGLKKIPALVRDLDDKRSFEIFLTENVQRQSLSPLEEARAFYSYTGSREKKCFSYGKISELAERIGKSQEYISNRLRLLKLPEWLLEDLLAKRNFNVSHAEELASLADHPRLLKELSELLMRNQLSVRCLERAIPMIKSGIDVRSAIELAKVETDLKLDWKYQSNLDQKENLLRRSKRVLESSLSYIDNVMGNFGPDEELNQAWIHSVRLKIHEAIDGVISCEKIYRRTKSRE
jgi:ParB family chromosome partitioning protein